MEEMLEISVNLIDGSTTIKEFFIDYLPNLLIEEPVWRHVWSLVCFKGVYEILFMSVHKIFASFSIISFTKELCMCISFHLLHFRSKSWRNKKIFTKWVSLWYVMISVQQWWTKKISFLTAMLQTSSK